MYVCLFVPTIQPCNCGDDEFLYGEWSFDTWNKWANSTSVNTDVRIVVGTPGFVIR